MKVESYSSEVHSFSKKRENKMKINLIEILLPMCCMQEQVVYPHHASMED